MFNYTNFLQITKMSEMHTLHLIVNAYKQL